MKLYTELLEDEVVSQNGKIFISKIKEQMEKIDFLMQSMLKMSRLETGIIQIQKKDKNLYETIHHAVADLVPEAASKSIDLYVKSDENIVIGHDSKWTEEAIHNILDNAIKYTEPGGKISIQTEKQELFLRSAFLIREKESLRKDRQKYLQDFIVNRKCMRNREPESDYILRER